MMTDWYPLVAEAVTEGNDGGEKEIVEEGKGQGGGVGEEGVVTVERVAKEEKGGGVAVVEGDEGRELFTTQRPEECEFQRA